MNVEECENEWTWRVLKMKGTEETLSIAMCLSSVCMLNKVTSHSSSVDHL